MKNLTNRVAFILLLFCWLPLRVGAQSLLVPGGQVVGLELGENRVTVAAFDEGAPGQTGGLQIGDEIHRINGKAVTTAEDVQKALTQSDGQVDLEVLRDGKEKSLRLTPRITKEGPKLGIYLRQSVTGIGTVTWYDPETGKFGSLGHGVNDAKGNLLSMTRGHVYPARVLSVKKGQSGQPGQLVGALAAAEPMGTLTANREQGVFGAAAEPLPGEALPVAQTEDIHTGAATIRSTVDSCGPQEYSVEILKIYPENQQDGRNLLLRVTDPDLLEATGGIVQGMSGSPIIQNGKLIGAVTHVLVNDPTTGYGIFIENMLDAAA